MFTGLIETMGEIASAEMVPSGLSLRVNTKLAAQLKIGDSIAVNGVCLTIVSQEDDAFTADVSPETARVTTLGHLLTGVSVNLERPLRFEDRIGGHFVQGHVDGLGMIVQVKEQGEFRLVTVAYDEELAGYIVLKGSIAVDGISLTVAELGDKSFDVQIVPHTWDHTNLKGLSPMTNVNLECDIIGKYVAKSLQQNV